MNATMSSPASSNQIGGLSLRDADAQCHPWPTQAAPITRAERQQRLEHARRLLRQHGVDALLITAGASLRYFTGVGWGASERLVGLLLTAHGAPLMICPAFEAGSLDAVLAIDADVRLWEEHHDPHECVAQAMRERGARVLAIDPAAAWTVAAQLRDLLGNACVTDASAIVDACRMCKSAAELALMQQACDMTLHVQRLAAGLAREGISTLELIRFIDNAHRALGADGGSTFCIVQFGHATAFPHGIPGVQQLREGELVLIDTGCSVQGYNSDVTRTWIFGQPTARQSAIWQIEREAQQAAFDAVRPGVTCAAIDDAARAVIARAGLGPDYTLPGLPHRTGHGCGLSIHEAPYLVRGNQTLLQPGMCCSNEPMLVLPEEFGIRLEDHFHVTDDGAAWFTAPSPAIDRPFA